MRKESSATQLSSKVKRDAGRFECAFSYLCLSVSICGKEKLIQSNPQPTKPT